MSEPTPAPEDRVEILAAALRSDAQDLSLYAGFLLNSLSLALPPDYVTVERKKSMRERMRGGEGEVISTTVRLGDRSFTLARKAVGAQPIASVAHQVNGIVLSTTVVPLDAWSRQVAAALVEQAGESRQAAAALEDMLRPRGI